MRRGSGRGCNAAIIGRFRGGDQAIGLDTNLYGAYTWNIKWLPSRRSVNNAAMPLDDLFPKEMRAVTKKEIVPTISEEIGLTQLQTKEIVQKTFNAIVEALVEDGRIELRNFGVFEVKRRAPRKARNPRTGDKVFVPKSTSSPSSPARKWKNAFASWSAGAAAAAAKASGARRQARTISPPSTPSLGRGPCRVEISTAFFAPRPLVPD